jgi:FkbM family methyltransferase
MLRVASVLRRLVPWFIRKRIRVWMFEWLNLDWELPSGLRVHLSAYGDWIVYNEIFVSGEYDRAVCMAFDRAVGTPVQVLDLGANTGFFTLRVLHEARKRGVALAVTAVEALPVNVRRIHRRLAAQPPGGEEIRVVAGLAGARRGESVFHEEAARISSSVHVRPLGPQEPRRPVMRLPFVDVSDLMKDTTRIDLLKCDIEGSEELFIENYPDLFAKVEVAVFELHRDLCDVARCQAMLRAYGFTNEATFRHDAVNFSYGVWR